MNHRAGLVHSQKDGRGSVTTRDELCDGTAHSPLLEELILGSYLLLMLPKGAP
jgi:hypothetical protein